MGEVLGTKDAAYRNYGQLSFQYKQRPIIIVEQGPTPLKGYPFLHCNPSPLGGGLCLGTLQPLSTEKQQLKSEIVVPSEIP